MIIHLENIVYLLEYYLAYWLLYNAYCSLVHCALYSKLLTSISISVEHDQNSIEIFLRSFSVYSSHVNLLNKGYMNI